MEMKTEKYLLKLGINPSFIGFKYLSYAIDICRNDRNMLYNRNSVLYNIICNDLKISKSSLIRSMQYAIESTQKIPLGEFLAKSVIELG